MMRYRLIPAAIGLLLSSAACSSAADAVATIPDPALDIKPDAGQTSAQLVLAGGCFWCTEAVFEQVEGVTGVVSGYAGGKAEDANYDAVSAGRTDHAEVIQITYDPQKLSFGKLLKVFFGTAHDPTQLNRQGPDVGRQYRSAVFYADDEQKRVAEAYIAQLSESKIFKNPIVTTLEKLEKFHPAEDYHQDYAGNNPQNPYVRQNVPPKLEKLEKLKDQEKK